MASLPNPAQVSGAHNAIYEAYYNQIDPKGLGAIEAMVAAKFLKKSGLSDVVLSRIWDLSDPNGKGNLDKPGFFVALKLVALAQSGQTINMSNIFKDTQKPPKVGDLPKILPPKVPPMTVQKGDWSIRVVDRLKYEQLFESLQPTNGLIAGNKVRGVLMDSKLPMETLGQIWDLADQDKDGSLDKHEFIVAMHLVYQALEKRGIPQVLPVELQKPKPGVPPPPAAEMPRPPSGEGLNDGGFVANFPKDIAPPQVPPLPVAPQKPLIPAAVSSMPLISTEPLVPISMGAPLISTAVQPAAATDWVVTPAELQRFEVIFRNSDRDKDGLVSGLEVKDVFLQSGVPQLCLAHIWALCDTNQSGKLTLDQFALAMWMVERKRSGIEPPQVLSPNMVPPSVRAVVPGVDATPQEPAPQYSNPELLMISKEIDELARERRILDTDIAQKEADIRIKSGEVRSLQSELDTLAATFKQLENQKGEAQKRLDDLTFQKTEYDEALVKINVEVSYVREQVNKIRDQCHKQEETINEQESELNSKRSELQKLKDEEASLEKEFEVNRKELDGLTKKLQDTQLQISQVRVMVTTLLETQRQMTDALLLCRAAVESSDGSIVSDYLMNIEPDFAEARNTLEKKIESPKKEADPFKENLPGFNSGKDAFTSNGFGSDPFVEPATANKSGFDENFSRGFSSSGFEDSFGSSTAFSSQHKDPFGGNTADPFGEKKSTAVTPEPGKDDFGSDPFANLHAPTGVGQVLSPNTQKSGPPPRPESPSPALPPKKAKQPPPRPAPPRPLQAPSRPNQPSSDAFGSSPGGFADFDDFDTKQVSAVTITQENKPMTSTTFQSNKKQSTIVKESKTVTSSAPTDFSDDPFKDYRYEDPFSIKDPFDDNDDENPEAFFADSATKENVPKTIDFSSSFKSNTISKTDDKIKPSFSLNNTSKSNLLNNQLEKKPTSQTVDEFADKFNAFPTNSEVVFENSFNSNELNTVKPNNNVIQNDFNDAFSVEAFNVKTQSKLSRDDLTDAFSVSSSASSRISPLPGVQNSSTISARRTPIGAADDNFANFDAFSTIPAKSVINNNKNNNNASGDQKNMNATDFFDAFNDNFKLTNEFETNAPKSAALTNFDAFGGNSKLNSTIGENNNDKLSKTSNIKVFDDFNDNFEDDFFKMKIDDNNKKNTTLPITTKSKITTINQNFGKFDGFNDEDAFGVSTNQTLNNKSDFSASFTSNIKQKSKSGKSNDNNGNDGGNISDRFAEDYSKGDTFEDDLQEVLKRSMAEK